jgi:hypothetical protein
VYALIYGLIAVGSRFGLGALQSQGALKLEGLGLSDPWVQSVAIGLSTKALLHIRLFTVTAGSTSVPIGIETVVMLFEPWLLRTIDLDEFNQVRAFLAPKAAKHPQLSDVKARIAANVPGAIPTAERQAFLLDVNNATSVEEALELYLRLVGPSGLNRVFP